jgi:acetyl-CoA/propionyl-CoA carboxylase biotin carboxyl carrier protein
LREFEIEGPKTLVGFHLALLSHPCFVAGETCQGVVESEELAHQAQQMEDQLSHKTTSVAASSDGRLRERVHAVEVEGRRFEVKVLVPEPPYAELLRRRAERERAGAHAGGADAVVTPMQGTVLSVEVAEGDEVRAGQVLCVVEAMKMENEIAAHRDGVVTELAVTPGQSVTAGETICVIGSASAPSGEASE